ncbi:hypothetical protein QTO34_008663 [Cnephaeus nilssonii]|uniref:Hepatocyte growth factor-regulated tyrosine kinase substrate n=1 Tax=Cnephaeus nilssonii TaxID=3371016 RepID=A0AA40HH98_CNENI|nr:hypothetical protein QTO34_008663 [Eptesicus nilssonii]
MGRGSGTFERLLDKATSQLLLETDWESILQICDLIRQGDTQAKYAVSSIKKKVSDKNPHVALYALEVMESVTMEELKELLKRQVEVNVRNKILYLIQAWAHAFRNEPKYKVVQDTYQIMKVEGHVFPEFKESDAMFAAERAPDWVDAEECHRCRVQFGVVTRKHHCRACGQIFCGKCSSRYSTIPKFGIEKEVRVCEPCYEQLNKKADGKAPPTTELPPEYLTSPLSQQSQLPPKRDETALQEEEELQLALALSQSEAEEKERMRQKSGYTAYPKAEPTPVTSSAPPASSLYASPVNSSAPLAEDMDPELARYLNRNYWEKKQEEARKSPTPSAPAPQAEPAAQPVEAHAAPAAAVETALPETDPQPLNLLRGPLQRGPAASAPLPSDRRRLGWLPTRQTSAQAAQLSVLGLRPCCHWSRCQAFAEEARPGHLAGGACGRATGLQPALSSSTDRSLRCLPRQQFQNGESEESHAQFLKALQNAVSTFVNRMKSNHVRGRSITNDSAVLSLFQSINSMHPQLLELLNQLDERRLYYEGLQDKLAQIRDARGALSALREEHREKLRRAAEEAERQRQIQLAQKLEIMRQKKQEYLEKERQLRLEQQKQTIQMRAQMPAFSLPYAQLQAMPTAGGVLYQPSGPTSFPGTYSPAGSVEGSPMHTVYMSQPATAASSPYPSMPGAGADPSVVSTYMYPAGVTGAQTAPQGPAGPAASPAYSSYQPTPTQGYQTVPSQPPQPASVGYMGSQAVSMGYQPYAMQNLMTALPSQDASLPPPPQPYISGQQPMYQQMAPAGGPPQQPPPGAPQPPAQGLQVQGSEAQLISFD